MLGAIFGYLAQHALVEKVVHPARRYHPLTEDEPSVKVAAVHPLIAGNDTAGKRRVILERKVDIQRLSFRRFDYPLPIKPVVRTIGVAVEPDLAACDRAACAGLLDKGAWHQDDLIHEYACQRHTLYERLRALILSAEKIKAVRPAHVGYLDKSP